MATKESLSVGDMAAVVVASDPELQQQLKSLVKQTIRFAIHTMNHGSEYAKMQLVRQMTPHMLAALQEASQTELQQAQQEAYERVMREMRGEVTE